MEQESVSSEKGALDQWQWDAAQDTFVRAGDPVSDDVKEIIDGASEPRGMSPDQFERLFDSEAFRNRLAQALRWGGRVYGLKSLQVDQNDGAYQEAMEVAYRRLVDGPGAYLLQFMSNRDLVDFFILSAWVVPFGKSVFDEVKEKKKAKALAQAERAKTQFNDKMEGDDNE